MDLKSYRQNVGLTQIQFAHRIGMQTAAGVANLERRWPDVNVYTVRLITEAFPVRSVIEGGTVQLVPK